MKETSLLTCGWRCLSSAGRRGCSSNGSQDRRPTLAREEGETSLASYRESWDKAVAGKSMEEQERLHSIWNDVSILAYSQLLPQRLTQQDWEELLYTRSRDQRHAFLLKKARKDEYHAETAQQRQQQRAAKLETLNWWMESRCRHTWTLPSLRVVLDAGLYDYFHSRPRQQFLANLANVFVRNREARQPCQLSVAGLPLHEAGNMLHGWLQLAADDEQSRMSGELSRRSLPDWLREERLVYITPLAEQVLETVDESETYMFGPIVGNHGYMAAESRQYIQTGIIPKRLPLELHGSCDMAASRRAKLPRAYPLRYQTGIIPKRLPLELHGSCDMAASRRAKLPRAYPLRYQTGIIPKRLPLELHGSCDMAASRRAKLPRAYPLRYQVGAFLDYQHYGAWGPALRANLSRELVSRVAAPIKQYPDGDTGRRVSSILARVLSQ